MGFRVIGAGMPRTGTLSLRTALIRLLDGPCYQMEEVFDHLEHVAVWRAALRGDPPRWNDFLRGYVAAVDWPVSVFWREMIASNPGALVRTRLGMIGPPLGIPNGGTASIPLASKEP